MNTEDNDQLPEESVFGDDERSIEDIIREDREDAEAEDEILYNEEKKRKRKIALFSAIGGLAVASILVGGFFYDPFDYRQNDNNGSTVSDNGGDNTGTDNPNIDPALQDEDSDISPVLDPEDFYLEEGNEFPTDKQEWQKGTYSDDLGNSAKNAGQLNSIEDEATRETVGQVLEKSGENGLLSASGTLPYEAAGYTSNDAQALLDDGTINSEYSYWTAEVFSAEATVAVERLLNPTFGEWGLIQYPAYPGNEAYDPNMLGDLFTNRYLDANVDSEYSEYIPVYADWNGDNYGGNDDLLESGPRWYGEVVSSQTEFVYNEENNSYTATMTADVKFTAWAKDQSKLEKNGTLVIKFVPNTNNEGDANHKVLIDDASLKVEE